MHPKKLIVFLLILSLLTIPLPLATHAKTCPELKIIYARGSGEDQDTNASFAEIKNTLEPKLKTTTINYEFEDLTYPAVAIGMDTLPGIIISGGNAYKFGDSVKTGTKNLIDTINACPDTNYVLLGYSQGAIVVMNALEKINPNQIIYAATFGDPKVYFPEGIGLIPPACQNIGLSEYRKYAPDCRTIHGILGARIPYRTEEYLGKVGTWCNKKDIMCSTFFSIDDHVNYISDGLYEDASRIIFDKITETFHLQNTVSSQHDTAFLIDSTGSMGRLFESYKKEALRLAEKTLNIGGRIALFDYRDLQEGYELKEHCDFSNCTLETFTQELDSITADGGGDDDESLLSAALHTMKKLSWQFGATKSLVILTDAGYHMPDFDHVTIDDVVKLSQEIDPVNFYIITEPEIADSYQELANRTGGAVITDPEDYLPLSDQIIERSDALKKEIIDYGPLTEVPYIETISSAQLSDSEIAIDYASNNADSFLLILNDAILGQTTEHKITLTDLDSNQENIVTIIPLSNGMRGEPAQIVLEMQPKNLPDKITPITTPDKQPENTHFAIPGIPNTGTVSI